MRVDKIKNLRRAVNSLLRALALPIVEERDLGGIVKAFECAYELSWTCLKAYLREQGHEVQGARDVFRTAWRLGVLPGDEEVWLDMIVQRNLTVHTYDAAFARDLVASICTRYAPCFVAVLEMLAKELG